MYTRTCSLLGLFTLLLMTFSLNCHSQIADTTIYIDVDTKPQFIYLDNKDTQKSVDAFIFKHKLWPTDDDIVAKISIHCIVEKDGVLSNFKVIKGLDDRYNRASIDVIKLMPKWIPGKMSGQNVRTQIIIQVKWDINKE